LKETNCPKLEIYDLPNLIASLEEGWLLVLRKEVGKWAVVNFNEADIRRKRMWVQNLL
jgi:hypothetical protein